MIFLFVYLLSVAYCLAGVLTMWKKEFGSVSVGQALGNLMFSLLPVCNLAIGTYAWLSLTPLPKLLKVKLF